MNAMVETRVVWVRTSGEIMFSISRSVIFDGVQSSVMGL